MCCLKTQLSLREGNPHFPKIISVFSQGLMTLPRKALRNVYSEPRSGKALPRMQMRAALKTDAVSSSKGKPGLISPG